MNPRFTPVLRGLVAIALAALTGACGTSPAVPPPASSPSKPPAGASGNVVPGPAMNDHGGMAPPSSGPGAWAGRSFREGVVAVSHPLAAEVGARVLEGGGNAIDAAAAIQFALNVVEPQFSGIGGGLFMLVYDARSGETVALDARERAPAAADPRMFLFSGVDERDRFDVASTSGISVGVPGTLLGIDAALKRWGTRSLADTMAPAIALADDGFAVNRFLADDIADDRGRTSLQPETAAIFRPRGVPLKAGERLVQPDLARTFRVIARDGVDAFYRGEIARAIVAAQQRSRTPDAAQGRGRMALEDLAGYRVAIRAPLRGRYRGVDVVTMPPPSAGGVALLQSLAMLERHPLGDPARGFGFQSVTAINTTIEALRVAFADRAKWVGDPDVVAVPVDGLLAPEYLAARAALVDPRRRMATPAAGQPRRTTADAAEPARLARLADDEPGGHTTHFTVADRWGNVVAVTSTIENTWGTGIVVPGYGFLLNNELTDFNLVPLANPSRDAFDPGANDAGPGKRPRSSMTPTMLMRDGRPIAAYGSPGGPTIISSVLLVTSNLVDFGMLMQDAIDAPRVAVVSADGAMRCDGPGRSMQPPIAKSTQDALRALGHPWPGDAGTDGCTTNIGSVQGVLLNPESGRQYGGADQRREGTVVGLPRPR
jgi:gamma-glutamyltranspeptidase/glutathione hydrolase